MTTLTSKRVLITGGTTGIGLASAHKFKDAGATLAITGNDLNRLEIARKALGDDVTVLQADAGDVAATQKAVQQAAQVMGGLDILFLNAGIAKFAPLEQVDEAFMDAQFDVNVKGVLFAVQAAVPLMTGGGSIIVNTSINSQMGMPGSLIYAASKAAAGSLVRVMAAELADKDIRVNAVSPGPVETPIYGKLGLTDDQLNDIAGHLIQKVPLGRFGRAEEIADVAMFLASDASSFVNGSQLTADGGLTGVMA